MTNTLGDYLTERGYKKIKLRLTKTNHFEIRATINGIKGRFILDTGASSSCVGFNEAKQFNLITKKSDIMATGAGASNMTTKVSDGNTIKIGRWNRGKIIIVLFNLTHVNTALINHSSEPVHGIIGADILKKGKAIIDYEKKYLYLK